MKILLTTLNSKFIHANLALRYLRGMGAEEDILLREYTINDRLEVIAGDIFQLAADVIGFSCYIWNITETLELIDTLHQVSPETIIILGGPEVSYDPGEYLTRPGVDFVVFGEGEQTWRELLTVLRPEVPKRVISRERLSQINGLAYRADGKPVINQPRELIKDLGTIPSPYLRLDGLENKIAYVESTRGCPFNCQYCLSSTFQGVRYFPLERTKQELKQLIAAGVTQVKFVDRTFNCNKQHALAIWRFLAAWHPAANFHFEISADLLDEEIISFLRQVPPGLFQFEIGVQSTNSQTLDSIRRKTNLERLAQNVQAIAAGNNIAQFLDLIAGLPEEDYASFAASFNQVYSWAPDKLQLGFLKLLKGSGVREKTGDWGYRFTQAPPYKVLASKWLSYADLLKLQIIEDLVDKYFNSHRFVHTLKYLIDTEFGQNPFAFYEAFARFWEANCYHRQPHSAGALYGQLLEFYDCRRGKDYPLVAELLKLDYLLQGPPAAVPAWFQPAIKASEEAMLKQRVNAFLRTGLPKLMPGLANLGRRELHRYFHLELFQPLIADYLNIPYPAAEGEPLALLFYYPGNLVKAPSSGFIPVII